LRFQGTGGGGYATCDFTALAPAVAQGYAAVATDGGQAMNIGNPETWALVGPGNVNQYLPGCIRGAISAVISGQLQFRREPGVTAYHSNLYKTL
jgi:hypothetical protein